MTSINPITSKGVQLVTENLKVDGMKSQDFGKVPFQVFLDQAVESLNDVSDLERTNNELVQKYIQGKATVDELMVSTNQLTLAVSLATTVINTAVQSFQTIQQMAV